VCGWLCNDLTTRARHFLSQLSYCERFSSDCVSLVQFFSAWGPFENSLGKIFCILNVTYSENADAGGFNLSPSTLSISPSMDTSYYWEERHNRFTVVHCKWCALWRPTWSQHSSRWVEISATQPTPTRAHLCCSINGLTYIDLEPHSLSQCLHLF